MTDNAPSVDLDALVTWAESDAPLEDTMPPLTGEDARRFGQDLLRRAGRPSLGHSHSTGDGRSPRRQVRLPHELSDRLDRRALADGRTPSELIRDAVEDYLTRIGG